MKSGGEFSRLKALGQSFKETWQNIVEKGVVEEWKDSGTSFQAVNVQKSLIQEPMQEMVTGIKRFVEEGGRYIKKTTKDVSSKVSVGAWYLIRETIKGVEGVGEGLAKAYTARTEDQLVEGLSQFYGGVAVGAGLVAGGMAGASVKATLPALISSGSGIANLAVAGVAVGVPAITATAGAVAAGSLVHAMAGNQGARTTGGGRGESGKSSAVNWRKEKGKIRSLSPKDLSMEARVCLQNLKQGKVKSFRPQAELLSRELKRRNKGQMAEGRARLAAELDEAIENSRFGIYEQANDAITPQWNVEVLTSDELLRQAQLEIKYGLEIQRGPRMGAEYRARLTHELRARSTAFEGDKTSTMTRLADELEAGGGEVIRPAQMRAAPPATAKLLKKTALPLKLPSGWQKKGGVIRSLADEELAFSADRYIEGLNKPNGGYNYSRPVAELIMRELKRRSKEGMVERAQQLELAIKESAHDHMYVTHGKVEVPNRFREDYTISELSDRARASIGKIKSGVDEGVPPSFHRQLVDELRERSLALEGKKAFAAREASAMRGLADELDGALQRSSSVEKATLE